ncbi:hypothetical protein [Solimonas terrae]|uniref:Phosphatidate cytidylyltransferase n=1 Tax=Solimonas terrae TaxID=1396819 RepID=A0A6M2BMK6_9GAMM|nr:hypothetical protein [Solimonas terrae]NGY03634.1 hypothetical protein [Solimonas terrae]
MSTRTVLHSLIAAELHRELDPRVVAFARALAQRSPAAYAVLFYGSALRDADFSGLLDFYVVASPLRDWHSSRTAALANELLPVNVSYEELTVDGQTLRAKVAVLSPAQLRAGMRPAAIDTTIWARFSQPAACVWVRDAAAQDAIDADVMQAVVTAARWAALLGPESGTAADYWQLLYQHTYAVELRVERGGARAQSLLAYGGGRYAQLLPLAWRAAGIAYREAGELLTPALSADARRSAQAAWSLRRLAGKPLNILRLAKAAFTFDNGADYLAWKIERHSGFRLELSDWQRRHPVIAAPRLLWRLWRRGVLR